jgi:hypothetical protein
VSECKSSPKIPPSPVVFERDDGLFEGEHGQGPFPSRTFALAVLSGRRAGKDISISQAAAVAAAKVAA